MLAAAFAASAKVFASYETAMANVSTMVDDTVAHMARFERGVAEMAITFGESTGTLAAGLYDILSASVAPEKALKVLESSAKAAKAGITDTGVAADAITTILNVYGLEAERAGDVSDWLFGIVKRGKITFAQLAPNIGKVATLAATANLSMEELGAMIAVLTRNGVDAESSMTAISAIISAFLKPEGEAAVLAHDLGFELNSLTLQSEKLYGVFQRIGSLPPEAIAKLFPNIRAIKGLLPALNNMAGFSDDLAIMANRAGMTETAYRKMAHTMGIGFAKARESVLAAMRAIGGALAPALKDLFTDIGDVTKSFAGWIERNEALVVGLAKVTAGLLALGIALKALSLLASVLNPLGLIITAAAATIVGLEIAFTHASRKALKFADDVRAAAAAAKDLANADQALFNELSELAKKQSLTNDEQKRAQSIISTLTSRYGQFGVELDLVTGKLTLAADSLERFQRLQAQAQIRQTRVRVAELRRQIKEIEEVMEDRLFDDLLAAFEEFYFSAGTKREQAWRALKAELMEQLKTIRELEGAVSGKRAAAAGAGVPAAEAVPAPNLGAGAADERLEEMWEQRHRRAMQLEDDLEKQRRAAADKEWEEEFRRIGALAALEKETMRENARLRIEATMKGAAKQKALLDLERKWALERAAQLGMEASLVEDQFKWRAALINADTDVSKRIAGTFSATAAGGMGMGSWQGKMIEAAKDANRQRVEELRELKEINDELKLVLRFAP